MRSIEPRRDLFHFYPAEPECGVLPRPANGWSMGPELLLEPQCSAGNDWEKYWIDLGGEG